MAPSRGLTARVCPDALSHNGLVSEEPMTMARFLPAPSGSPGTVLARPASIEAKGGSVRGRRAPKSLRQRKLEATARGGWHIAGLCIHADAE